MTDLGPLDALGAIEGGADYDQLLPESLSVPIGGRTVHVLSIGGGAAASALRNLAAPNKAGELLAKIASLEA
jgi:hypothetical protein